MRSFLSAGYVGAIGKQAAREDVRQLFFDVDSFEENSSSSSNPGGIDAVCTLIWYLARATTYQKDISSITTYKHDIAVMKEELAKFKNTGKKLTTDLVTTSVDAFQGRQNKNTILHSGWH